MRRPIVTFIAATLFAWAMVGPYPQIRGTATSTVIASITPVVVQTTTGGACPSSSTGHCVNVTWLAPTTYTNGAAFPAGSTLSYIVLRSATSGSGYTQIAASVSGAAYEDDSAVGGNTYFYVIEAVLTINGSASAPSANSAQSPAVTALPLLTPNPPGAPQVVAN